MGQWSGLPGSLMFELPPPSPASSDGSTGMVPIAGDRGSAGRRDRRMNERSCLLKERSMLNPQALQLRVGVDVGSQCHSVAVGLTDGGLLEEFEIPHTAAGFGDFFACIEGHGLAPSLSDCRGHGRLQWPRPAARQPGQSEGLAAVQCQQPEAGALQGNLSGRRQERSDRLGQDLGAVPAPRSPADDRRCPPGSHGDARGERYPQARDRGAGAAWSTNECACSIPCRPIFRPSHRGFCRSPGTSATFGS